MINIKTKDAPDSLTVKLSISGQYNPQVHMKGSYLTYEGGNSDWLGFDDGTRAMPEEVLEASQNNDMPGKVSVLVDPAERTRSTYLSRQFNPVMDAKTNSSLTGMTAQEIKAKVIVTIGASINIILFALAGIIISLNIYFKASAKD